MRIPFSQLRFSAARACRPGGCSSSARIARKQEQALFAFTPKNQPAGVARFGHLDGLAGIRAQRPARGAAVRLGARCFRLARRAHADVDVRQPVPRGSELVGGVGADVKYRVTSNFTLDATFNPDFGQVELDPAVVNLTAFETQFAEKRPFFVEGAEILRFGTSILGAPRAGRRSSSTRAASAARRSSACPTAPCTPTCPTSPRSSARPSSPGARRTAGRVGVLEAVTRREERARSSTRTAARGERGGRAAHELLRRPAASATCSGGRATLGGIATAVNRQLATARRRRSSALGAYAGGVDFRTETADRVVVGRRVVLAELRERERGGDRGDAAVERPLLPAPRRRRTSSFDPDRDVACAATARRSTPASAPGAGPGTSRSPATSPGYEINDLGFQTQRRPHRRSIRT